MCDKTIESSKRQTKKVLIVGAGPAGLLAAILLLRRNAANEGSDRPRYAVTLVDPGVDYGKLDADGLTKKRSWMIGLSCHGIKAIRSVPDLYEKYVHGLGVDIQHVSVGITNNWKLNFNIKDFLPEDSSFTVDRNYICSALARYLNDHFLVEGGSSEMKEFVSHYETKALFVDGDEKQVLCRSKKDGSQPSDMFVEYDLLLGCDGIRSIVRNAFISTHREFEFNLRGTFGLSKSVHVPLPEDVKDGTFMFLNNPLPNSVSFILPETDQVLNVALGFAMNKPLPSELESDDASLVSAYFKKHFKAFDIDCDETGKQWVSQGWNTISQVHCNFYHSISLSALLLGDAAHATSPQIGQGMNTALDDAAALNDLLDAYNDDIMAVLPVFSKERVKEGNALTDLSFYTFSLSGPQQMALIVRQEVHAFLHRKLPWLFSDWPMKEIPKGMKLSEAYDKMVKLGVIDRVRKVNDDTMREYFEKESGMVTTNSKKGASPFFKLLPVIAAVAGGIYLSLRN